MSVKYNDRVVEKICQLLRTGMPISKVFEQRGMPSRSAFYQWQNDKVEFREVVQDARIFGCHALADDILSIADDDSKDYIDTTDEHGNHIRVANKAAIMRDRLRIDTRKWLLAKMLPKIYGDKVQLEHKSNKSLAEMLKAGRLRVQQHKENEN